jgi:predicted DNA-binding transcriptional regulator YafY
MSQVARYAERFARLPELLAILELHPDGLRLDELATELGTDVASLREVVVAYYGVDLVDLGDYRLPVVEFVGSDGGDQEDPTTAPMLRVASSDPERELGVDYLSAHQLATLLTAGQELLALEPGNDELRSAIEALQLNLLQVESEDAPQWGAETARVLREAADEHRRVRMTYDRAWHPGRRERVIEPYRVVHTRRGWEVDAGPPDEAGRLRTFLVSGVRSADVLDEVFADPPELDAMLTAQRRARRVELVVPQDRRWVVERFAESTRVLDDDEESVKVEAELLEPFSWRLGLILLICGEEAFVMQPHDLSAAGSALAAQLLAHHEGRT